MKLCVIAGEASGDLHAAGVIRELRLLDSTLVTFGIGGDSLAAEGMEILHHARQVAIVGLFNVLRHLPKLRRAFRDVKARIRQQKPDAVLLVDFPGFNLRLARWCRQQGIRVIYYISPQVWAWRKGRVREIARSVELMIVIFPFEEQFYREQGVNVSYVGNPLIDQLSDFLNTSDDKPHEPVRVALMPGSRDMEVELLLPSMLQAVDELRRDHAIDAYIIKAPTIARSQIDAVAAAMKLPVLRVIENERTEALARADLAICSSGTATLEAAILGTPSVVVYKLSPLTYWLAKHLVNLPHFSLVNIVAGKEVVPELLQDAVSGSSIAKAARRMLDPATYASVREELSLVRTRLGDRGASRRAAEKIYKLVAKS